MFKNKITIVITIISLIAGLLPINVIETNASSCSDLKIIFVRGSGGVRFDDPSYQAFKNSIETKLKTTTLSYDFVDLDYPAVAVGFKNFFVSLGALISGGEYFAFGNSVNNGSEKLTTIINKDPCEKTKYVIGGYSQGAMVISKSLPEINPDKIIYVATFGDPKLYLPEGKGLFPAACREENLSNYRAYVPDCYAYEGLLGGYQPYQPDGYYNKLGTWCNKSDIFCSSHFNPEDHRSYISDGLYEDASRIIFSKITDAFGIESSFSSPHDTVFIIDSTRSMSKLINDYKVEALRLASETLSIGGRIALYEYRDLNGPFETKEHCNFETCTIETFEKELISIVTDGGGDIPESLLSASFTAMKNLSWQYGATKSIVVLTDANFVTPDRDGTTLDEVVQLSKSIDPVNFYIITNDYYSDYYTELAERTDGKIITDSADFSFLTDYIMGRYDSLPKVETSEETPELPFLQITNFSQTDTINIKFNTNAEQVFVAVNDNIIGYTTEKDITFIDLDLSIENEIILIPVSGENRGNSTTLNTKITAQKNIKAPNTGFKLIR